MTTSARLSKLLLNDCHCFEEFCVDLYRMIYLSGEHGNLRINKKKLIEFGKPSSLSYWY